MRKIDESLITGSKAMFFKQGTWTHLQKSYTEIMAESIKAMIGSTYSTSTVYVLNGCKNTGSGANFIISAGSVFFNGEIYLVDATTFTTTGAQVGVATITITNNTTDYNADPCLFSDGTYENVHNIRKFVIANAASGSGTKDYSLFNFYGFINNYVDVSSAVTVAAGLTVGTKSIKAFFDGRVQVHLIATYVATVVADTVIMSGLPLGNVLYTPVRLYAIDGVGAFTFADAIHVGIGDTLQNKTALTTTYNAIHVNYFYQKG